jgi:CheY-like chemotaxis protein
MKKDRFVILVVDDDISFCEIMQEILHADGYEVQLAFDVPEALSLIERNKPDLILSDIMMPDIDGLTFIRSMRTRPGCASIPTIAISARTMPEEREAARIAGANAFVPKPFSFGDLRTMIRMMLFCPVGTG